MTSRNEPAVLTTLRLRDLPDGRWEAMEIPSGPDGWGRMADSYKEAADHLAKSAKDSFTYAMYGPPVLFLYRHYIELRLKALLVAAGELLDDPQTIPPEHYILSLWKRVRSLLLRISPESDGAWFTRADVVISDFDSLDPTSFAFRYPVDKKGTRTTSADLHIDPKVARQMIGELDILLNGAASQIAEYMGYKNEQY